MAIALAIVVFAVLAMKVGLHRRALVHSPDAPAKVASAAGAPSPRGRQRFRTLGDLMAANYGWKPAPATPAAPASARGAPIGGRALAPRAPGAPAGNGDPAKARMSLLQAVAADDVCAVDRLLPLAGKDAAVEAFLAPGMWMSVTSREADTLRVVLEPGRAGIDPGGTALQGLRFLDALERAGLLRIPGAGNAGGAGAASSAQGLYDLAQEDPGNAAYAFFALPSLVGSGRDPRDLRYDMGRSLRAPRFEAGLPEILALLAKQGLSSASHLYLSAYLRASAPQPSWVEPVTALQSLLSAADPDFSQAAEEFGERLEADAIARMQQSPATRRWDDAQLAAGIRVVELAYPYAAPGEPLPLAPMPPLEESNLTSIPEAIRALGRESQPCDRSLIDRAVRDERARLRM
jgi:hypothetical protein